jgi:hypothetical protein
MTHDPTTQRARRSSGSQLGDVLGTIILLVAHFIFFTATFTVLGLMVMTTDSCGYQKCGDSAWLDRAMFLALWAGGAFLFVDVLLTVIRLVRQRVAWWYRSSGVSPSWQWPWVQRQWNYRRAPSSP